MDWSFKQSGDIFETKTDCTVIDGRKSYLGVAHLILFQRDNLRFWFARINLSSDIPPDLPKDKKIKLQFPDGTFGWCYNASHSQYDLSMTDQQVLLDVVGIGEMFPKPVH